MRVQHKHWETKVAALTFTGIILFLIANIAPFMGLESSGIIQQSNILGGVQALIYREQFILASLVFITIFLFPLLELSGLFLVVVFRLLNIRSAFIGKTVHLLHVSRPWSMLEIFLLGVAVASIKLGNIATIVVGPGLISFTLLVLVLIANNFYLSREAVWDWLYDENYFVNRDDEEVVSCHCCQAHVGKSIVEEKRHCPRCNTPIYEVLPDSQQKTWALLIAATVLYIPSNTLPIMTTTHLGQTTTDTIFSGVVHLTSSGDFPIALVVFVASIVVPIAKLLVMAYLLLTIQSKRTGDPKQMILLFRITEFIGRWSMIDVFVVTMLVALVQFGLLANIEPGAALLCFASVVVLTMLAAETFDSKLIWRKAHQEHESGETAHQ